MKKRKYIIAAGLILILAAGVLIGAKCINRNFQKNNQTANVNASDSKDVTVLDANLSVSWAPGIPMEGWFIEHIKEKLGIEVSQVDATPGVFDGCEKGVDVCFLNSAVSYYNAVKAGKLKNLEKDIAEQPQVYQRYQNAIDGLKADTYKNTGKKGVYGIPVWLDSFDDTWKAGYCLVIPAGASHPEQAMDLITYSASDEGIMDIAFGPEGQMWEKKNGSYVLLQDWKKMDSEKPGEKFIKSKSGMQDYQTAVSKLELVGNENLGNELLKMSSGAH